MPKKLIVKSIKIVNNARNGEGVIKEFDVNDVKGIKAWGVRKKPIPQRKGGYQ